MFFSNFKKCPKNTHIFGKFFHRNAIKLRLGTQIKIKKLEKRYPHYTRYFSSLPRIITFSSVRNSAVWCLDCFPSAAVFLFAAPQSPPPTPVSHSPGLFLPPPSGPKQSRLFLSALLLSRRRGHSKRLLKKRPDEHAQCRNKKC